MIHEFKSRRKMIFFPVKWANAVARWCLGLHSPSGTLRIKNTATPDAEGAAIDVDVEVVARAVKERFNGHFSTAKEVRDAVAAAADGSSIVSRNGRLQVSEEWVKSATGLGQPTAPSSPTALAGGNGIGAALDGATADFTAANAGFTFYVLSRRVYVSSEQTRLYFRPVTVASDGRISSIGAETASFNVYPG